ncbi:MAG: hypothetical protein WBD40_05480 [Tepidisphaeraceae bacterium]
MAIVAVMDSSTAAGAVVFGFNADGNAFDGTGVWREPDRDSRPATSQPAATAEGSRPNIGQ